MSGDVNDATEATLLAAGYTPESAAAAVAANDLSLLKHPGKVQVSLLPKVSEHPPFLRIGDVVDVEDDDGYVASLEVESAVWIVDTYQVRFKVHEDEPDEDAGPSPVPVV